MRCCSRQSGASQVFAFSGLLSCVLVFSILLPVKGMAEQPVAPVGTKDTAVASFQKQGIPLTVRSVSGKGARRREPVTGGIPLPPGSIKSPEQLALFDSAGKPVPCQVTMQCPWPDGSVKWALLDFQADLGADGAAVFVARPGKPVAMPDRSVKVVQQSTGWVMDNGLVAVSFSTNLPGLIQSIRLDGREVVGVAGPVQTQLKTDDGSVYRAAKPDRVVLEHSGPMRSTVLIRSRYVRDDGATLMKGGVFGELRATLYSGSRRVKLDFTLKNESQARGREGRIWAKSLELSVPLNGLDPATGKALTEAGEYELKGRELSMEQWYKYPAENELGWQYGAASNNFLNSKQSLAREKKAGMKEGCGFYSFVEQADRIKPLEAKTRGWLGVTLPGKGAVGLFVRDFWQNYPCGLSVRTNGLSAALWPVGGFWPRNGEGLAHDSYQFEARCAKTYELLLNFDLESAAGGGAHYDRFQDRLTLLAPAGWYAATGAIWPLAPVGIASNDKDTQEAIQRYDRLQQAKVHVEKGDPGAEQNQDAFLKKRVVARSEAEMKTLMEQLELEMVASFGRVGKVSIPSLKDRCPDVYCGFMNFGDLTWAYGYCSLFYDWSYAMLMQGLRFGDPTMIAIGDEMARHRHDIDRGDGFQSYEKGFHGDWTRNDLPKYRHKGYSPKSSHTWNRGLFLHWALTGDPLSREAAMMNAEAYFRLFDGKRDTNGIPNEAWSIRAPGWAIENTLAAWEYTGEKRFLDRADETFRCTLLAMERSLGNRGYLAKDGHQAAQMTAYITEPVARLHHLTGKADVAEFLRRVLDWHWDKGRQGGVMEGDRYRHTAFVDDWVGAERDPDGVFVASPVWGFPFADGYAYLYEVFKRDRDRAAAHLVFRDVMFYHGQEGATVMPSDRTPLGYHFRGTITGMAAKVHALSGRYGQVFLEMEGSGSGVDSGVAGQLRKKEVKQ